MHGNPNPRHETIIASPSSSTPIYDEQYHKTHGDVMESLSLRRDLSQPEKPPFGVWWTYTVEETLIWPILEFQGSVNSSLDVLLEYSDEESDDEDTRSYRDEHPLSNPNKRRHIAPGGVRSGLDDGTVVPELIESFLRNVHSRFPILEPNELRARAANLVENGLDWGGITCQVLLACALGSISSPWDISDLENYDRPKPSLERYSMARDYFSAGQKRLGALCTQSSLTAAQCMFMAGTFLLYLQKPVAGWRLLNMASTTCRAYISKRIARETRGERPRHSRSMEQRLCWSCFKAEREVACEFGMETAGLNVIAYSTSLPTPPNGYASDINGASSHKAVSPEGLAPLPVPHEPYEDQSWYFFLTEIMLCKLEMRIDNFFQDKRREAYRSAGSAAEVFFQGLVEALQEFRYQLSSYYESLPPVMRFPLDDFTPCEDELRHYLRWRLYSVKHDICLPALYALLHNDISRWPHALVNNLIELANACLKLDVIFQKTAVTAYRHHNTWLGLRKGIRSALILIAARRLKSQHRAGLERLQVPDEETCRDGARALVRALEYWSAESRDCAFNLRILRNLHSDFRV
ncbi:hypothetical protein BGZ61DRAFT_538614 [Ilyonectria robusta]|uniref:uncharacterized protein n=1 Tax=Ilyonectria robusta TaxID=1079257 RepID=UPI001E8ED1FD|nr:uncharacterized protein BGZ61DRAFT_538614 [Ilyonectria robusta]KAH8665650.1 hypothetical protein BGZ61DRAFT_538614 [Ilyonectria robusta]